MYFIETERSEKELSEISQHKMNRLRFFKMIPKI